MASRPVSVTRFERKLRALLGAAGSTLLEGVEDHVGGLLVLEADRPEWALAGGELLCWNRQTQASVAGQRSAVVLRNRPGTGVVGVLEAFDVQTTVEIRFAGPGSVKIAALDTVRGFARDLRATGATSPPDITPALQLVAYSNVGGGGGTWVGEFAPGQPQAWLGVAHGPLPVIVGEDCDLILSTSTDATQLRASFVWREVPLEGSRLG